MTPEQLAAEIEPAVLEAIQGTAGEAAQRILSIGREQYHNAETGRQKFEGMPFADLLDYADEEILDLINYAVMTRIRLRRLRAALVSGVGADMFADANDEEFKPGADIPLVGSF